MEDEILIEDISWKERDHHVNKRNNNEEKDPLVISPV